jgi:hypothetical protein
MQATAAAAAAGRSSAPNPVIELHHTIQRLLEPCDVVVPFAKDLVGPAIQTMGHVIEARRAFGMLLDTVRAIAMLYQHQRRRNSDGAVEATVDDYGLACDLLEAAARQTMGYGASEAEVRCEESLQRLVDAGTLLEPFTTPQAARALVRRDDTVRGWLKQLVANGKLVVDDERGEDDQDGGRRRSSGRKPAAYRFPTPADVLPAGPSAPRIPMPEDVWPQDGTEPY